MTNPAARLVLLAASFLAQTPTIAAESISISAAGFGLALDPESQTARRLSPADTHGFSFVPGGGEAARSGHYRLGDLDLRYRSGSSGAWRNASTAFARHAVRPLPTRAGELAAADLMPTLPADLPFTVERRWLVDGGQLALRFTLTNRSQQPIEIGGLGLPMIFDNILTGRSLEQAHEQASFYDPYVGCDAGYLQVTRLNGKGPALLVVPEAGTPFEAYKPILDARRSGTGPKATCIPTLYAECTRRQLTFEGFYDWMAASKGFAEREWKAGETWNTPTAITLAPGERREVGVRFLLAPTIRAIETTLIADRRPVAVGLPGYVVPQGAPADLFVKSAAPVTSVDVFPRGALALEPAANRGGWARYRVRGLGWGRARVTLGFADGRKQTVHYFMTKPAAETVNDLGQFLTTQQWFDKPDPRFGRSPSIMGYDRMADRIVDQEQRVWIAGLSDEGGAGAWLAAIMKQLIAPDTAEISKFEAFADQVIDGRLQVQDGPLRDGVRKSLFWYDAAAPAGNYDPKLDWSGWSAWKKDQADSVVRSFNYVHVAAAQWVLYRLARNFRGLVKAHDWRWYLDRAYRTSIAMVRLAPRYAEFGQMEGDVFVELLKDLRREGLAAEATELESAMKRRAYHWRSLSYPFGSEMPWDSTGQPEVYAWLRWFGDDAKAAMTREVILAYDPLIPHWGYNGSARRYWDFLYAGQTARIERQLHHYGSALNAVPLFDAYRRDPADLHLLRVAYGGLMGSITNIDRDGFGAAAFHSFPDMMRFDGYSGDYGMSFFGHALATGSYLVDHPEFGWVGFGGTVEERHGTITMVPHDSGRIRLFVASAGLWLTLDAGRFERVDYMPRSGRIAIRLAARDAHTPAARLRIETTAAGKPAYRPVGHFTEERGAQVLPLGKTSTTILLRPVRDR